MTAIHEPDHQRFIFNTDAGRAVLVYRQPDDRVLDLTHTYVPPEARGEDVGDALVTQAVAYARRHDLRITPTCPFTKTWFERNPQEQDLLSRN